MSINVTGWNHKTSDIRLRERLAFVDGELPQALADASRHGITDLVIISTCNRTELISANHSTEVLLKWCVLNRGLKASAVLKQNYMLEGREAIKHLIEVACGMDSMIVGETQVFGQLKKAFNIAKDCGAVDNTLQHVFEQIFKTAKIVRTDTEICKHPASVHMTAVHLMEKSSALFNQAQILLIGAGNMIGLIVARLVDREVRNINIINRTLSKAITIAEPFNINAVPFKNLEQQLVASDIVVSCTGSPQLIIDLAFIHDVQKQRDNRPWLLIDLAVPRNIDYRAGKIEHIKYHDIDALQQLCTSSHLLRQQATAKANIIIDQQIQQYQHTSLNSEWITQYRQQAQQLHDIQLKKSLAELKKNGNPEVVLTDLANKLTKQLMHIPSAMIKKNIEPKD